METKRNIRQPHGGGRMEEKKSGIAMHCTEMNEVRSACSIMRKEKRSIETAWLS